MAFSPRTCYFKRHVWLSKYDPLVDEVELIEANPSYAHIQHKNGSQSTVSLWDLAPITDSNNEYLYKHLHEINISHNDKIWSVIFNIQIKTFFIKIAGGKIVMVVFFSEIYVVLTMTFMYIFSL